MFGSKRIRLLIVDGKNGGGDLVREITETAAASEAAVFSFVIVFSSAYNRWLNARILRRIRFRRVGINSGINAAIWCAICARSLLFSNKSRL